MKKTIAAMVILATLLLSIMGVLFILNLKLNEKYVYDSSLPNGNPEGIAEVMKQDVSAMTSYIIAFIVWSIVLTAICIRTLFKRKTS